MGNIDFRAKQQELLNTQQHLRDTQAELDDKTNQLEDARLKNEDEKSELIEQLLSEIDALKENAKNYEKQIKDINAELNTLRTNFNNISQSVQPTPQETEQPASQETEQPTPQETEQPAPQETEQPASQETEQPAPQETEQPAPQETEQPAPQETEQPAPQETEQPAPQETEQQSVQSVNTQQENTESQIDIYSSEWYLLVLNELLNEIKDTKEWITKRWIWKSWKETMKLAKTKLKQYEKAIKAKKRAIEKQKNPQIFESDINQAKKLKSEIDAVRQDVSLWQRWELSNLWSFLYNSPENARQSNKQQDKLNQFAVKYKEEVKKWAISNIFGRHEQTAIDFYRRIAEGKYTQADYQLFQSNAQVLIPSFQRCGISIPVDPSQRLLLWNNWSIDRTSWNIRRNIDYSNMDRWETFQQWGIAWIIDKGLSFCKNMTPWQRNTRKWLLTLWGYAAWIYGLFKFFTNKKMWFWWKALTTWWVIFASQALTWEWPLSLFNKLMTGWLSRDKLSNTFWNAFWDAVDWVWNSGIESASTIAPAMYSMMIFNSDTTVWNIRTMTNNFKSDPNARKVFHWEAMSKLKNKYWERSIQHFSATFSDSFDEQKWTNWLASFWVTDSAADNTKIYELANNATMNEIIIEKFKTEHWLKETSNEVKKKEFKEYVENLKKTNQAIDIDVLQNHSDWFELDKDATYTERPEDIQNKENLANQVEALSIDPQKKSELKTAVQRFYDERTIDSKPILSDFSLKMDNNLLILTSHGWQESKIDINNWELIWFWNGIRFSNLSDLLNTADIANKILESQKWQLPKDLPAFQYKLERKWICFNNANSIWKDIVTRNNSWMDTRVLSTWRWWTTSKIDTLYSHPEEYANYLSNRWLEQNKINIDVSLYPTVKKLSDEGIVFTNEQEVKEIENWLKWIKENLKFSVSTPDGNPFSITFTNKLEFKAVNWDTQDFPENISEKFPTLLRTWNKEKFLKMINNPNNKMRWSVHN